MSRNYKFHNPEGTYFTSFAVVEWLIAQFLKTGAKSSNVNKYQFWRHNNKPIELQNDKVIAEKINYIHNNPVEEGLVYKAEDYVYSSARDYSGEKGILDDVIVVK